MQVNTYLNFPGNCEAALHFYEKTLGAQIKFIMPVQGSPIESDMPPEMASKVLHASFELAGNTYMASDMSQDPASGMKGFAMSISTSDPDEAERLFDLLAQGGQVTMPLQQTFWALRFGSLIDQFGTPWMMNCEQPAA